MTANGSTVEVPAAAPGRKEAEARSVLNRCLGQNGLWASPQRYRQQCWTRDFAYAGLGYLLDIRRADLARAHLLNLAARQKQDGSVPIMFLDDQLRWLAGKAWNSLRNRRLSFLLKRYFSRDGIGWLSPWTRDSEILFIIAVKEYCSRTGDTELARRFEEPIGSAINYIGSRLMAADGLVLGADWRDTREDLDGCCLLTNNILLARALRLAGWGGMAESVERLIRERFWTGGHFRDYVGGQASTSPEQFDTLGNAWAILHGLTQVAWERESIIETAESLNTAFGYRLNTVTLPPKNAREAELMSRISQAGVIWPFIHGFMAMACLASGYYDLALRGLRQWDQLEGFWEWYSPETGEGRGSPDQMWSAAVYLELLKRVRADWRYRLGFDSPLPGDQSD